MRQAQKYVSGLCNKIYVNNQKVAENILTRISERTLNKVHPKS